MSIAIVVLTHNKPEILPECVENVLMRTSDLTREIVIWNNGSFDETRRYLDTLTDPRIRVVHHDRNIGQNAYRPAFAMTSSPYMIEVDDDIADAPANWDRTLLEAFQRLPRIGFLAASLIYDPHDTASSSMHANAHLYTYEVVNGVRLKLGPVGGGCTMTSRELHDRVGGFPQAKRAFFYEDEAYIRKIQRLGYDAAYLAGLEVHHKGGPHYAKYYAPEKRAYYVDRARVRRRKDAVKRVLLGIPFVPRFNARFGWFQPPPPTSDAA